VLCQWSESIAISTAAGFNLAGGSEAQRATHLHPSEALREG